MNDSRIPTPEQKRDRRGLLALIGAGGAAALVALLGRSNGAQAHGTTHTVSTDSDPAIHGLNTGEGPGVRGDSNHVLGHGVLGSSIDGIGVRGSSSGGPGVIGGSVNGPGVIGSSVNLIGVDGESTHGQGVRGLSLGGDGVQGDGLTGVRATANGGPDRVALLVEGGPMRLPLLTTAERDLLTDQTGLVIYNTTANRVQVMVLTPKSQLKWQNL